EIAIGALVLTVMLIFSLDVCLAMMLYGVNDRACRDAARAAARATKPEEAEDLAKAALKSFSGGGFLVQPEFVSSKWVTGTQPRVSVTTRAVAKLPAPLFLLGQAKSSDNVSVQRQYTFPILGVKPQQAIFLKLNPNLFNNLNILEK